ncbi:MAG: hypothetical protein Q9164_003543 [Protoblastenia rupestris]
MDVFLIEDTDVFLAVQFSPAAIGVVPFENSSNGAVDVTLDCLIDSEKATPDIAVWGETYLDVQHCLMGHVATTRTLSVSDSRSSVGSSEHSALNISMQGSLVPPAQPNLDLQHITDVYSHPQALGQCRSFLSTYLKHAEQHEESSTSKAASIVAKQSSPNLVAVASNMAAGAVGLDILATNIQDSKDNTTRFLILQQQSGPLPTRDFDRAVRWKSLLAFSVNNDVVGALADALHVFKQHKLNLTNIDKRPNRLKPWHYTFIVEFQCNGSTMEMNYQIKRALEDLVNVTESSKHLGCWKE